MGVYGVISYPKVTVVPLETLPKSLKLSCELGQGDGSHLPSLSLWCLYSPPFIRTAWAWSPPLSSVLLSFVVTLSLLQAGATEGGPLIRAVNFRFRGGKWCRGSQMWRSLYAFQGKHRPGNKHYERWSSSSTFPSWKWGILPSSGEWEGSRGTLNTTIPPPSLTGKYTEARGGAAISKVTPLC